MFKNKILPHSQVVMSLKSQGKIPHKSAIRAHTCVRARAINQCRLMTVLMGKCTGFPQGHQGPEHFNWQDQILLPFPSSSPPSPARDNAVCILIHHRVSHSASQSLSRQLGGMDVRRWGAVGGGAQPTVFVFFPHVPWEHYWLHQLLLPPFQINDWK